MLSKNKSQILILFTVILALLPAISSAAIICNYCQIGLCTCQITDCQRGLFNAYRSADCSGSPMLRGIFNNGVKTWYPSEGISYYALILCDEGTRSVCTPIAVAGITPTTTITETTTTTEVTEIPTITTTEFTETSTTEFTPTTSTPSAQGGGSDWFIWVLVFIILIVVVAFFFMKRKKAPKSSYEALYKKWSR